MSVARLWRWFPQLTRGRHQPIHPTARSRLPSNSVASSSWSSSPPLDAAHFVSFCFAAVGMNSPRVRVMVVSQDYASIKGGSVSPQHRYSSNHGDELLGLRVELSGVCFTLDTR